jgi:PAS domain S-box-containing protein
VSQKNERRILIVDNSESDRAVYVRYLQAEKKFSYQIIETDTLEAGLASWERNRPDLVLLDINLPDGNGLEFLEAITQGRSAIAQTYPAPKLPVIVMTSQTDTRMLLEAMKRGASDYLFKEDSNAAVFRRCVAHAINELELSRRLARLKQQEILSAEIALRIRAFLNLDDIYQAIVTEVRQFLATDRVIIYQFNPDMSGQIVAESVIPPWQPSLHAQIIDNCLRDNQGIAYQQGKIFAVSDIYHANLTDCHVQLLADFQVRANLVVPILLPHTVSQTNPLWGLLIAHQCSGPRHWEADDMEILQRLSVQLAIALQQSIAYEKVQNELAEKKRAESTLQKLIVGTSSVAGEAFFPAFVQNMTEILEVPYGLITELVEEQLHTLGFWANGVLQPSISYAAIHTPCEKSLREGQFYCERYVQELFPHDLDLVTMKAEGYLGVALKDHEGNAIGNLCILDTKPITESKQVEAIAILKIFAARASAELQRKQADEKLQQLNQSLEIQVAERTAALQESEITNRTILQTIPDLLLRLSPDGTCLDYIKPRVESDKFLPITNHISEVLPPEIVQSTLKVIEQAIATQELQIHEHQLVKHDRLTYEEIRVLAINDQEVLVIVRDISDRKTAEIALVESEAFNRQLITEFPIGLASCRMDGQLVYVNPHFAQILGRSIEETLKLSYWEITPIKYAEQEAEQLRQLQETGSYGPYEKEYIHQDGHLVPVVLTGLLIEQNQETLIWSSVQDISDRKQAEEALKISEVRFRNAFDTTAIGMCLVSPLGEFLKVNPALCNLWGYSETELVEMSFQDITHPDDLASDLELLQQLLAGEITHYNLEKRYLTKEQALIWGYLSVSLVRNSQGEPLYFVSQIQDITDQKQAEIALQQSEERFRRIFYSRVVGMIFADFQGNIIDANDCFLEMIGYTREELETGAIDWLGMTPPEYLAKDYQCMEYLIQNGEVEPWEKEYYRKDGSRIAILIGAAFLPETNNETICVIIDISDRKQSEKSLQEKNTELETLLQLREETLELREDMSNMIVHDLRTPLTTISLAAGLINQYGDRVGQRALIVRKAGQILDSAKQLEKMIDSLLFMAKLESGKILFSPIATDLHYLGAEVIEDFELVANSRNIELRSELPNLGEMIPVDATILRRIIDNLMSNALKFSPVGGQVTLSLEYLPENRFRVKVADTGTGIAEAEKQKIFQKFEIGSLKRNVSQTGLGLAFCKMAVEAQGGTLAIADNHPQGAIFIVEI